jgi:hypothetical protein
VNEQAESDWIRDVATSVLEVGYATGLMTYARIMKEGLAFAPNDMTVAEAQKRIALAMIGAQSAMHDAVAAAFKEMERTLRERMGADA